MRLSDQIREEMEDGRIVVSPDAGRLLPTPSAAVMNDGESIESWEARRERVAEKGYNGNGMGMPLTIAVQRLLPTPNAGLATSGPDYRKAERGAGGDDLATAIAVLPPATSVDVEWGEYEPAIRAWEAVIGRPAPSPVRFDGRNGAPRLSPEFTEWMMGWPAGWLTDPAIGLTRNEALKACGNGVVTLQAILALRELLSREGVPSVR